MAEYNDLSMKGDGEVIISESKEEMKGKMKNNLRGKKYLAVLGHLENSSVG